MSVRGAQTHSSERMKSMRFETLSLASGTSCGTRAGPRRLKTLFSGVRERNSCVSSDQVETHFVDLLVLFQLREELLLGINDIVQLWGQAALSSKRTVLQLSEVASPICGGHQR